MPRSLSQDVSGTTAADLAPLPRWQRLSAASRLCVALLVAFLTSVASEGHVTMEVQILLTWNAGVWVYLAWTLALVARSDADTTRLHAGSQAQSNRALMLLLLGAALASVVALGFLIDSTGGLSRWGKFWHVGLSATALLGAWSLVHLLFAFHYAGLYYAVTTRDEPGPQAGLSFGGDRPLDYSDFVYLAFAVGMSSTVPDVATTDRQMRNTVLLHGVVAFAFNIIVLALSVNFVAAIV